MKKAPLACVICNRSGNLVTWNKLSMRLCPVCGLVWRNSFDLPETFYASLDVGGHTTEKTFIRRRNAEDRVARLSPFLPQKGICDIGTGDGTMLAVFAAQGYQSVWGIEPSHDGGERAKKQNLDVVVGELSEIKRVQQGRPLQALTLFHVIEHLDDPVRSLEVIYSALPPGGFVVIETPDAQATLQRVTNHCNWLVYPEHLFYWNKRAMGKLLKQSGFEVIKFFHRSFDWQHAPIRRSLVRLGFRQFADEEKRDEKYVKTQRVFPVVKSRSKNFSFWFRVIARWSLAYLVHLLRRDDYLMVVARRR